MKIDFSSPHNNAPHPSVQEEVEKTPIKGNNQLIKQTYTFRRAVIVLPQKTMGELQDLGRRVEE